jgi:hypothetical protein
VTTSEGYTHRVEVTSLADGNLGPRTSLVENLSERIDEVQDVLRLLARSLSPASLGEIKFPVTEMRIRVGIDLEASVGAVVVRGSGRAALEVEITWELKKGEG